MNNTCKGNESPEFIAYWNLWQPYSRKVDGRGLARETFRKQVTRGADPQDIVDGAAWFLRSLGEKDKEYIPLSSTWLNREGWDGLCDKERTFQASVAQAPAQNVVSMQPRIVLPPNHFLNQPKEKQHG